MRNVYLSQPNYLHGPKSNNMYLPYAVGCIWAYALKDKYIKNNYKLKEFIVFRDPVEDVINKLDNPKVFGFSCYMWNEVYQLALSKAVKNTFPNCLIIFGGPQVPDDSTKYLKENSHIDVCIRGEGEEPFRQILLGKNLKEIKGVFTRDSYLGKPARIENLDDIPSPYTNGIFDELMLSYKNIDWNVMLETNRGCPYKCTFCDWGSLTFNKIKKYSIERVKEDFDWVVNNGISWIFLCDANFGILKERDAKIIDYLIEIKNKTGYPSQMTTNWAKHSSDFILNMANKLYKKGLMRAFTLSVQSMDEAVLEATERKNMGVNDLEHYFNECNKINLPYYTELILGLPYETYDSWVNNIIKLLELGQHSHLDTHFLQLLRNSPLNKENRTMKVVEVVNFEDGSASTFKTVDDYTEVCHVVIETETMSFNDFLKCVMFNWMIINFHSYGWTQIVSRYLVKNNITNFRDFYINLENYIHRSKFLKKEYNNIKSKIKYYFIYGQFKNLKVPAQRFIYSSQFEFHKNSEKVWNELKVFFNRYEISEDLYKFQQNYIRQPNKNYPIEKTFNYNWFDYIVNDRELKKNKLKVNFDVIGDFDSLFDYGENLYFRKRQSWGNTIIN
jgi:radical SAM superfamily enzyme YgiQ (UPF0313 family)